jgi:N-acetylmuramoyl-L-alanine amidase
MKSYSKALMFFLTALIVSPASAVTSKIINVRLSSQPDKTRLVFDVSKSPVYFTSVSPDKIIINIKEATIKNLFKVPAENSTAIKSIKTVKKAGDLRLILYLKNPVRLEHFPLDGPRRLVFDLYPLKNNIEPKVVIKSEKKSQISDDPDQRLIQKMNRQAPKNNHENYGNVTIYDAPDKTDADVLEDQNFSDSIGEVTISDSPSRQNYESNDHQKGTRPIIVVIDPGHGGRDSGAVGFHGTMEKKVTLGVAKALQKIINKNKGFRAVLTRSGDYFIPLRHRLNIAHAKKADIFVSIHADAYIKRDAHGVSVFALSQKGATSEAARWIAQKENESELGQAISDKSELLRSVLIDLAQTATISASLDIGSKMLKSLSEIANLHFRKVEQAAFVVLKSPDIPSLLVEVGFITYGPEERKLRNVRYQEEIATRLALGIESYFIRRPPPGTYLANVKLQKYAMLKENLPE